MNAQELFDSAPLGSLVRFSNGHPRPPERHRRKLRARREENGEGRFVATDQLVEAGRQGQHGDQQSGEDRSEAAP